VKVILEIFLHYCLVFGGTLLINPPGFQLHDVQISMNFFNSVGSHDETRRDEGPRIYIMDR
jgi:hypothetical protein